jgi:DNA-binding winged helix-turn-helix (wHTH) protein
MPRPHVVYRFGDFELHPQTGRLLRAGERVRISSILLAILVELVTHAPHIVEKAAIERAGWSGAASVSSVEKSISRLRQALGDPAGTRYIETVPHRGYRFIAAVQEIEPLADHPDDQDALFHALVKARRELARMNRRTIAAVRRDLERIVARTPGYGLAHVELALAYAFEFEGSRFDPARDVRLAALALSHGRAGRTSRPVSAIAASTLALALGVNGAVDEAAAAACRAIAQEPDSWRHYLLQSFVSWGEERRAAAEQALRLRPGLAYAYWLQATVFIARGAFEPALAVLDAGCAAQDHQHADDALYRGVGLHLRRGLVLAELGRLEDALHECTVELDALDPDHLFAQECAANCWHAIGAIRRRQGDPRGAESAFRQALTVAPAHLNSMAALGLRLPAIDPADPRAFDAECAKAIALACANQHAEAARVYAAAVAGASVPSAGWTLPVEPLLNPSARPAIWRDLLGILSDRAT